MDGKFKIEVEELELSEIPESELINFEEVEPIKISNLETATGVENEEILIKKYVNGEVDFPELYTTLRPEDDIDDDIKTETCRDEIEEQLDSTDDDIYKESTSAVSSRSLSKKSENDILPSTSNQKKKMFTKRPALSATLLGLMGEANLCLVRGKTEIAEKICLEIIRQNPLAPEPFFTLAEIYENKDPEKFLNFSTLAAHLDPQNRDQWIRIAEIHIERENFQQARICYSKGIKHLPKDFDLRLRKAQLLQIMNEERESMTAYLKLIPITPPDMGEFCLQIAKNVAKYFHKNKRMATALEAMDNAYKTVPSLFTIEDLNLYLELLLINKLYSTILNVLEKEQNISLVVDTDDSEVVVVACIIPDTLISDFRVKLCVSLIHLQAFHLLPYIIENVLEFIPRVGGIEWYVDIAEALMVQEKYEEAIKLLRVLIDETDTATPAYVWLKHAECLRGLGNIDEAISSYYSVVELAPRCFEAKFTLSALLKQQGRHNEAVKALEQDLDSDINPLLLYEHCLMLRDIEDYEQFLNVGYVLLARNSIKFHSREEITATSIGKNSFNPNILKTIIESRLDSVHENNGNDEYENKVDSKPKKGNRIMSGQRSTTKTDLQQDGKMQTNLDIESEYNLFKELMEYGYKYKKFPFLQKLCFAINTTRRFQLKHREIEKYILLASYYNSDSVIAYNFLREILGKNLKNNAYWNFFNMIVQSNDDTRYSRFLKRVFPRFAINPSLRMLLANYHLSAGSLKYALNIYGSIYKDVGENALLALCMSGIFSHMATQKNIMQKSTSFAHAITFMNKYAELRMSPETHQEILYNYGRIYHQSTLLHLALHYYEESLKVSEKASRSDPRVLSLQQETAYNIHLIYKTIGNYEMARKYIYKYIII